MLIFFATRYIKCPPDKAMVTYGSVDNNENAAQIHVGGAQFIWPVIQDYAFLDLKPFHQEINETFTSKDLIDVPAKLSLDYGISTRKDLLQEAASRFLGQERKYIQHLINHIILGKVKKVFSNNDLVFDQT